jgi:hypothetical protein
MKPVGVVAEVVVMKMMMMMMMMCRLMPIRHLPMLLSLLGEADSG